MSLDPIRARSERPSREGLTEYLVSEIMSNRLTPTTRLPPERRLAEEFKLSRPIVREVLRGLQERGLVEIVAGKGTFVQAPSPAGGARSLDLHYRRSDATARDVVDARRMVEAQTARRSALHATEADIEALERCLSQAESGGNIVDRARSDITFHGLLARASANPVIETIFASIAGLTFEMMLVSLADPDVERLGLPYHRRIVEAVRARDPGRAEAAMIAHLELAESMYGDDYDRSIDSLARRGLGRYLEPSISLDTLVDEAVAGLRDDFGPDGAGVSSVKSDVG